MTRQGLRFEQLFPALASLGTLPRLETFRARDGATLGYRRYEAPSPTSVILVHGSSAESSYLHSLARAIAATGVASVYTPDLRGHGPSPQRRGDIDYIGQLEDDLADLVALVHQRSPQPAKVVIAGHSSGGGLAIRFAGGRHGALAAGYLLLSPYLGYDAPTVRKGSGGWAMARMGRIVALLVLNGFGVTRFNSVPVLHFNLPENFRTGNETLAYSYRLMTGINPGNFRVELAAVKAPLLLLAGADDEAFFADRFEPAIRPLVPDATVKLIPGATHLGLVAHPDVATEVVSWLRQAVSPP